MRRWFLQERRCLVRYTGGSEHYHRRQWGVATCSSIDGGASLGVVGLGLTRVIRLLVVRALQSQSPKG